MVPSTEVWHAPSIFCPSARDQENNLQCEKIAAFLHPFQVTPPRRHSKRTSSAKTRHDRRDRVAKDRIAVSQANAAVCSKGRQIAQLSGSAMSFRRGSEEDEAFIVMRHKWVESVSDFGLQKHIGPGVCPRGESDWLRACLRDSVSVR